MNKSIYTVLKTRLYLLDQVKDLTTEQLNKIPDGFVNNIIWHLGHMISSQQGLCYTRSGVPITVDDNYYTPYRPGTIPVNFVDTAEVAVIKELMISTLDQLDNDLSNAIFITYDGFESRYGILLDNITVAVDFVCYHEGLHAGFVMALKRAVS
jgi:hypothetical protein